MDSDSRILVLGARGMVGRAILRCLYDVPHGNVMTWLGDLRHPDLCELAFKSKPEYVFVAAAKVGGIGGNRAAPADFGHDNALIACSVLQQAKESGVRKLLFLGSSCIYPRECPQPMRESDLLTGPLEPSNELYALSKILGTKLCDAYRTQYGCNFISAIPCNLYGPNDKYGAGGHVIPSLIRRFHEAKEAGSPSVECWGSGEALREFLHVDDLAAACVLLMNEYDQPGPINVGSGLEISIRDLSSMIADVVGFEGELQWGDASDDGTPRKLMDSRRMEDLGWTPTISLKPGIEDAYHWYVKNMEAARG